MVLFNHATREMTAKIVYYGPGLCGKTTNLLVIFDKLDPKSKGKMLSLATKSDRTLFFDLLPVDIGKVGAFNLKMQLYTVPGQVFYNETRKLVLRGADAVVFVADSQPSMLDSTRESFANLLENLEENQIDVNELPIVIQFNKRDIPGVLPVEVLQEKLGFEGYPFTEASAIKGEGVMETFKLVSKITAKHLIAKLQGKPTKSETKEDKKKAAKKAAAASKKETPAVAEAPLMNPFADSVPFPESGPIEQDYDKMEEVSLEQLLEGRDRPSNMGEMAVPFDVGAVAVEEDVDSLHEGEMVSLPESPPFGLGEQSVAAPHEDSHRIAELEREISVLQDEIARLRSDHETLLADVRRGLAGLNKLVQ